MTVWMVALSRGMMTAARSSACRVASCVAWRARCCEILAPGPPLCYRVGCWMKMCPHSSLVCGMFSRFCGSVVGGFVETNTPKEEGAPPVWARELVG